MTYYTKTLLLVICFVTLYLIYSNFFNKDMQNQTLSITSPAFENNQSIPAKYTCDGENINPALKISGISNKAKSLVLVMDDPDAPSSTWDHWIKFNIPVSGDEFEIAENTEPSGISGKGTGDNLEYEGPCPPDREHRYFFKAYALDTMLDLNEGVLKKDVEKAMEGHILQTGELVGLYNRK